MDAKIPKRHWFQFYLSTAVVTMSVAALVIRANWTPLLIKEQVNDLIFGTTQQFGWPLMAVETNSLLNHAEFLPLGLIIDIIVGMCIVLASMCLVQLIAARLAHPGQRPKPRANPLPDFQP